MMQPRPPTRTPPPVTPLPYTPPVDPQNQATVGFAKIFWGKIDNKKRDPLFSKNYFWEIFGQKTPIYKPLRKKPEKKMQLCLQVKKKVLPL